MVPISMKIENTLLKNFDATISKLKQLDILGEKENRSSIIKEFMKQYVEKSNKEFTKNELYNNREVYPSEKGKEVDD